MKMSTYAHLNKLPRFLISLFCFMAWILVVPHLAFSTGGYVQTNLVSDIPGVAAHTDPNLSNPWGISSSATSPFWVSDNKTGVSTLYNGNGEPFPLQNPLVVNIPPPGGGTPPAAPTGQVFNGGSNFNLGPNQPARFIFATEDGTISGWNPAANPTNAILKVDNSAIGAVYKGLAIGNNGTGDFLYAANFSAGKIDVFDSAFGLTTLSGSFTDPNMPSGFAPFNIQNVGGALLVTYAVQDVAKHDDVAGAGNGIVDVFDLNGNLEKRLISSGPLNSPWGLALAPPNFGVFSNDLLVGNFGDGRINAFDPTTGNFLGTMLDKDGNPIVNTGLWGMKFGNGGTGGAANILYFTAGIPGPNGAVEDHGLFGSVQPTPEPSTALLLVTGIAGLFAWRKKQA